MLILFDIDGTLLRTDGAAVNAMRDAGRELFGEQFTLDGVEFAGRLDSVIWRDLAALNRIADSESVHDRFRATYGRHLQARLAANPSSRLLPGVAELVHALAAREDFTVGLLTGNYPETGRLKIQSAGLDPDLFQVAAWGCDGSCRRDLPPVAMERHAAGAGNGSLRIAATRVVIIGDTPHDVDCAKAHGCRSIGVATGQFSVDELRDAGADLALSDLSDMPFVVNWLRSVA
jgi:phosphoglycolate phosphatase-like HAD superfamily hydrolase